MHFCTKKLDKNSIITRTPNTPGVPQRPEKENPKPIPDHEKEVPPCPEEDPHYPEESPPFREDQVPESPLPEEAPYKTPQELPQV